SNVSPRFSSFSILENARAPRAEQEQAMHTDEARIRSRFVVPAGRSKAGALLKRKIPAAAAVLGFLILAGCGGGYRPSASPNKVPYQKSFVQVQVTATAGPSIPISGTVLLSASALYQISPYSFSPTDVTNSAAWT